MCFHMEKLNSCRFFKKKKTYLLRDRENRLRSMTTQILFWLLPHTTFKSNQLCFYRFSAWVKFGKLFTFSFIIIDIILFLLWSIITQKYSAYGIVTIKQRRRGDTKIIAILFIRYNKFGSVIQIIIAIFLLNFPGQIVWGRGQEYSSNNHSNGELCIHYEKKILVNLRRMLQTTFRKTWVVFTEFIDLSLSQQNPSSHTNSITCTRLSKNVKS